MGGKAPESFIEGPGVRAIRSRGYAKGGECVRGGMAHRCQDSDLYPGSDPAHLAFYPAGFYSYLIYVL